MSKVEYKEGKVIRNFTPNWRDNRESSYPLEVRNKHADCAIRNAVEYIEALHDEIDRLNKKIEVIQKC